MSKIGKSTDRKYIGGCLDMERSRGNQMAVNRYSVSFEGEEKV